MIGYQHTQVAPLHHHMELAHAVARTLDHLEWRHHGIGLLQAYLREGESTETRVHIWHPSLRVPSSEGRIHDHRFDLHSHVLVGRIGHSEVTPVSNPSGWWAKYTVVNARNNPGFIDQPAALEGSYSVREHEEEIPAGCSYAFPKRQFHASRVFDLAVTLCSKLNQEPAPAVLLVRRDQREVVNGFVSQLPHEAFRPFIATAKHALLAVES